MLNNIIVIENNNVFQFNTDKDFIEAFICKDYYELTDEKKLEKLRIKAIANSINLDDSHHLDITNEKTFVLSLLINNEAIIILEKKSSNYFTKDLNKDSFKGDYIVVNNYAKELLDKELEKLNSSINIDNFPKAYAEVEEILKLLPEEKYKLIDKDFLTLIKNRKDKNYKYNVDSLKPIDKKDILPETRGILSYVYINYLSTDEEKDAFYKKIKC